MLTQLEETEEKKLRFNFDFSFAKIKPIWVISILLAVCLIFIAYQFCWKEIEKGIKQKGVAEGQTTLINWELQQLALYGGFGLTVPTKDGGTTTINVVLQNNATNTTK